MTNGQHVYRNNKGIERLKLIDRLALTKTEVRNGVWVIARPERGTGLTYWIERFRMVAGVLSGRADAIVYFMQ